MHSVKLRGSLSCTRLVLLALLNICVHVRAVDIRRILVPRWVQNGTEEAVVLDCEYTYNENDLRLVVKWFFNDNLEPVYQWIPELDVRHISGVLHGRLDLDFTVNTVDAYSRYRALRIRRPTTELSGKYTCLVTSLAGQDSREQRMTVFVPAQMFELSYNEAGYDKVNLSCEAQGLYPRPHLTLHIISSTDPSPKPVVGVRVFTNPKSGAYDIYLYRTFTLSELPQSGATVFECLLELPGTSYVRSKRVAYYPDVIHSGSVAYSITTLRTFLGTIAAFLLTPGVP